jgi:hypothetical protein
MFTEYRRGRTPQFVTNDLARVATPHLRGSHRKPLSGLTSFPAPLRTKRESVTVHFDPGEEYGRVSGCCLSRKP